MKNVALILSAILLALMPMSSPRAQDYEDLVMPDLTFEPPAVERFTLDNGLVIHFYEDHALPVVAADALFRTGEIYVPADQAGLAGLCGTVLRTGGTQSVPPNEFDEKLDFVGTRLQSDCDTETGHVRLRTLKKDVDLGLSLMSDMLKNPLFDDEKLQIAAENKIEEIRRENDNPGLVTRREFYRKLFPNHPYGRSATTQTISALTRSDLIEFHGRFYNPANCIIALSGDLTKAEALDLMTKYFGEWKSPGTALPDFPEIKAPEFGVYYVYKDLSQTSLRLGHPGVSYSNPDRYAVEVMNFILGGGGFLSRLANKIRVQEGLAYSVGSNFYKMNESGSFYAFCQTKPQTTAQAIEMMIAEVRNYIQQGATEKELETAKNSILNSDIFNYATPHQIVAQNALLEFQGLPADELTRRIEAIKAVTLDDVKAAAEKYLHPDSLILVVVGNEALFDKPLATFGEVTEIEIE